MKVSKLRFSPSVYPAQGGPPGSPRSSALGTVYKFRRFHVEVGSRVLRGDANVIELGDRAFDLLVVLVRNCGTVVTKRQIMEEVWPSTMVDDSNLRFQMACLRRALDRDGDVIKTVQGRGYIFVAEVMCNSESRPPAEPTELPNLKSLPILRAQPVTVAIVEDDEDTRDALDSLLRSAGYLVETYPSAQAFMDNLRSSEAECLVLDVWLPGRSGLDFQEDLKAAGADLPIVFICGHADVSMSVRAMKGGAVEFLTKPVRHEELLGAIQEAVRVRGTR